MKFYGKKPSKICYLSSEDLLLVFACFWFVTTCLLLIFLVFCLYLLLSFRHSSASTTAAIDNAVSDVIKLSKQISLTKNISFP